MFGVTLDDDATSAEDVSGPSDAEASARRPKLRGGAGKGAFMWYHSQERANFEAVKHCLSSEKRRDIERCFDRVALLKRSWIYSCPFSDSQGRLTTAAMAQHLSLVSTSKSTSKTKVKCWLDTIDITWSQPSSWHDPWRVSGIVDTREAEGPEHAAEDAETRLMLRGGGDSYEQDTRHEFRPRTGYLKNTRRRLIDQFLINAIAGRSTRLPGQIRYSCGLMCSTEVFTNFTDPETDHIALIERWLDAPFLDETEEAAKQIPAIALVGVPLFISSGSMGPPHTELQLQSTANNVLNPAFAVSRVGSFAIEMHDIDGKPSTEQNVLRAQAGSLYDGIHEPSATNKVDDDVQSVCPKLFYVVHH